MAQGVQGLTASQSSADITDIIKRSTTKKPTPTPWYNRPMSVHVLVMSVNWCTEIPGNLLVGSALKTVDQSESYPMLGLCYWGGDSFFFKKMNSVCMSCS